MMQLQPLTLRPLTKADAELFRAIRLRALKDHPAAFSADYEFNAQQPLSHFEARIHTDADNFMLGAFDNDSLVGIGGFFRSDGPKLRHTGNIWSMYVAEECRGKGVGRMILLALIERAKALRDIEQIRISVVANNLPARALYLATGFEIFGREPRALKIDGQYYDEDHMFLQL